MSMSETQMTVRTPACTPDTLLNGFLLFFVFLLWFLDVIIT